MKDCAVCRSSPFILDKILPKLFVLLGNILTFVRNYNQYNNATQNY